MSIQSRSLSLPAELRTVAMTVAALALFIGSWIALHHGWLHRDEIIDTPVYEKYGEAMLRGEVPYRDFSVEYPPGALPVFVAPAVGNEGDADAYKRSFGVLMAACGVALLIALAFALSALGVSGLRFFAVLALAAISPLLLGSVVLTRFDLWPTALTAAALAALVSGRSRLGHGLLGAGILAKVWPGVVVPLAVAYVWRTRGRREALVCLGVTAAVVAAVVLPFVVALAARRVDELRAPALATAADREPRRRADRRLAPRLRHRRHDGLEPRLAEPRRHDGGRRRLGADRVAALGAAHALDRVRATPAHERGARAVRGGCRRGVRGARQGRVAAVPHLADPARAARAEVERRGAVRRRARAHAGVVPSAVLGLRPALRRDGVVARPRPRRRAARAARCARHAAACNVLGGKR